MNIFKCSFVVLFCLILSCGSPSESKTTETSTAKVVTNNTAQEVKVITSFEQLKSLYTNDSDTSYIVNLWATWCKPCVAELPYFNIAAEKLKDQKYKFFFASMDFLEDLDKKVKPFLVKNPLMGSVFIMGDQDVNTWGSEIDPKWDGAIPVTIMVSKGRKVSRLGSFKDDADLINFIKQ